MMKIHEQVFLSLVRNSLWNAHIEVPAEFKDWNLVMFLAETQAMQGSIAKALLENPLVLNKIKPGMLAKIRNVLMSNVIMHSAANSALQVLVISLRNAGIECVLLKGQGLAANYAHPELRECGDIDLYVGVENYSRSYEVLKNVVDEIDDVSVLKGRGKHYHAKYSDISVEVHKYSEVMPSSYFDKMYQGYASDGLSQNLVCMEFGDTKVMTPADSFNTFYVFNHLWSHFLSVGAGLRQVCDWAMLLHTRGANVDKEYLLKVLTEMKLLKPWKTFGCIAVDFLGLSPDEVPFYDLKYRNKAKMVFDYIIAEGDLGRETEFIRIPTRGYLREKVFSMKFYFKRFMRLIKLFPYHASIQLKHSILDGIGLLFKDFIVFLQVRKLKINN